MSAYQRFISYMYEYHGNTRHQNCGYARIDNRNQLLKIEIHMKVSATQTETPLHIYGCFQKDGQLYGIEFGQHLPTLGMVNWRMQCASDDLAQTGISFQDIEGLVLSDETPISYCSIWNDQSILPVNLIPYPTVSPEEASGIPTEENSGEPSAETAHEEAEEAQDATIFAPTEEAASPDISPANTASSDSIPPAPTVSTPEATAASIPDTKEPTSACVEEHPRTTPTLVERILAQEFTDTSAKPDSSPSAPEEPPKSPQPAPVSRWERLKNSFPAAGIFSDGDLKDSLRIEPKDIPLLRREGFHIAGNRFILHCFQRDPHCLLGRIGNSEQYIFAIPGIYDNQERFMANMFGFPCFKAVDASPSPTAGQKGYWYRAMH